MTSLKIHTARDQQLRAETLLKDWSDAGDAGVRLYRDDLGYVLRFEGLVDFELKAAGGLTAAWPVPGVSDATVDYLYTNQVLPLLRSWRGSFVLHGSAVLMSGRAVIFLGSTGMGKSTLATFLNSRGFRLLSDDSVEIDFRDSGVYVQPSESRVRLWDDSLDAFSLRSAAYSPGGDYTEKYEVRLSAADQCESDSVPLGRIYLLGEEDSRQVSLAPLSGAEGLTCLLRNTFFLPIEQPDRMASHMASAERILASVPLQVLDYPCRYDALEAVEQCLTTDMLL